VSFHIFNLKSFWCKKTLGESGDQSSLLFIECKKGSGQITAWKLGKVEDAGMGDLRIVFVQSFLHGGVPFKFYYLFKMILW